jgi:MFS family permease
MTSAQSHAAFRLIPVLFVGYVLAYLDRVNVSFARLAMGDLSWFNDAVFSLGAGVFFIGYFLFEVPANIMLHRIGARLWMTRIMVSWGLVSMALCLSSSPWSFYTFRFLLGVAEAGFFPGILLYLTQWFPQSERSRMVAWFMTAIAAAGVLGNPLSGYILSVSSDWRSLQPWQWLFVLEGIPSVVMGCCLPWLLPDGPRTASWLSPEEKTSILTSLENQRVDGGKSSHSVGFALKSGRVWFLALIYFGIITGLYGFTFWVPQIIKERITTDVYQVGLWSAIPWSCAAISMLWIARSADRTGARQLHVSLCCILGGLALAATSFTQLPTWVLIALLGIGISGVLGGAACFWALPTEFLAGLAAAAGIAWINSVGNLAGHFSPNLVNWLKNSHGMGAALMAVGGVLVLTGVLVWLLPVRKSP